MLPKIGSHPHRLKLIAPDDIYIYSQQPMSELLQGLNDRQKLAVTTTEGPVLVIAGAGSGKTRVLTRRLAYLIEQKLAEPWQILAVTFTNKASAEMKERVRDLVGIAANETQVSTFHSFCNRLLRRESEIIGYGSNFTILDADDSRSLVKQCIKELGISETQFPHRGQQGKISKAKNDLKSAELFASEAEGYFQTRTAEIYTLYQSRLRSCNAMDFDDLLFNAVHLLQSSEEAARKYQRRYKYLMVDEYQDTNHVQYLLLKHLLGEGRNFCVVGDEDQSIYGWRGADIRNILEFETDFPGATIIKLEQNYRSTATILKAASAVIANNDMRKGKTLWTDRKGGDKLEWLLVDSAEHEATETVASIVGDRARIPLKETAILYRTNAQSRSFEEKLRRADIPYQIVGGISFYQRKEIKDLMAYLRLIVNPQDDVSFLRVINYPKRGLGPKTIETIRTHARAENISLLAAAAKAGSNSELATKAIRVLAFAEMLEKYRLRVDSEPADLVVQDLVSDLGLIEELLSEDGVVGQAKVENIEAFVEGVAEFARSNGESHLVEYLSEISLFADLDTEAHIEDRVTLMTIHAAKGLEFDSVYLVGLEDGLFPLQRTIADPVGLEEERRLFYVGATRARSRLRLSTASARHRFGVVMSIPSRFVREIPEDLIDIKDLRTQAEVADRQVSQTSHRWNSGYQQPAAPTQSGVHYVFDEDEKFQTGRIVAHPTFGRGKIIRAEGFGDSLRLEIMFTGRGVKKIMARYARLKVVG